MCLRFVSHAVLGGPEIDPLIDANTVSDAPSLPRSDGLNSLIESELDMETDTRNEMQGKRVIVTGASSGIGRATANRFLSEGAIVVSVGRRMDTLKEVASSNENGVSVVADLSDETQTERCIAEAVEAMGGLDVVVNAAGILKAGRIEDSTLALWDEMMNINLRSIFHLMKLAVPHLERTGGNIVNVSSVTGPRSFPGVLAYCVSKAGLDQLTRCAALELAAKGIRVNAVNPGVVVSGLHRAGGMNEEAYAAFLEHSKTTHPLGRVGKPEEIADLIYFLASDRASWITGATVGIDGGRALTCAR